MPTETENQLSQKIADPSPRKTARIAGVFYLIFIVTTVLATTVRSQFIIAETQRPQPTTS
jgi:hypothetical protein